MVAERLLEVLHEPFVLDEANGIPITVTASIGVAVGVRGSADELLRDADVALYEAKAAGKHCSRLFRSEMQHAISDRLELEMDMRGALGNDEFFLVYQPIFDLRTETVSAVEALLRWRHPTRGVVNPDTFIPIAEETGLIVEIGRWVLNEVCLQAERWRRLSNPLGVSVNISVRQLETDDLADHVTEALVTSDLDPQLLTLEITESTLMRDTEATVRRLQVLKRLGVRLAVDDFGTGYSSLAYLREFPVDALKIDRSFIAGIAESSESSALIHTLIQLGKTLGLETLAEGIEERAQLERLQRERCDTGQGFLLARPLELHAMEQFLGLSSSRVSTGPASDA
jgi:EAL domain-containing protein (putative c-di-GMP-specific phosphodiesterase class I)